jgi:hypothetical protein
MLSNKPTRSNKREQLSSALHRGSLVGAVRDCYRHALRDLRMRDENETFCRVIGAQKEKRTLLFQKEITEAL